MLVTFLALTSASQSDCPPWFFPDAENGSRCACGSYDTKDVKCSKDTALLRIRYCMTYKNIAKDTEFGMCPYIPQHIVLSSNTFFF